MRLQCWWCAPLEARCPVCCSCFGGLLSRVPRHWLCCLWGFRRFCCWCVGVGGVRLLWVGRGGVACIRPLWWLRGIRIWGWLARVAAAAGRCRVTVKVSPEHLTESVALSVVFFLSIICAFWLLWCGVGCCILGGFEGCTVSPSLGRIVVGGVGNSPVLLCCL